MTHHWNKRYIANPYLINGKKFDLRVYVTVTSFDPLRIYLFDDGLVRFATQDYTTKKKVKSRFAHLTNWSVNKKAPNFEKNVDVENDGIGSKWSIKALKRYFSEQGIDDKELWEKIKDIIIKTLLSAESSINNRIQRYISQL